MKSAPEDLAIINMSGAFAPRPMNEVKEELLGRAKENRNPFLDTVFESRR